MIIVIHFSLLPAANCYQLRPLLIDQSLLQFRCAWYIQLSGITSVQSRQIVQFNGGQGQELVIII